MADGIFIAMAGASAQDRALDVVANNLANVSTVGFRAERPTFAEALTRSQGTTLVSVPGSVTDTTQGKLIETGNPLDLALTGEGYFSVLTPSGPRFTRAGQFQLDDAGNLVNANGHPVLNIKGRPITVPPGLGAVAIDSEGRVRVGDNEFGAIAIAYLDPASVRRAGNTLFAGTAVTPAPGTITEITPGALEEANFGVLRGMVDLVRISRMHEAQHRMIQAYREIDQRAAHDLGRGR